MTLRYRQNVLEALAGHGIQPAADTPVEFVRDCINDLYLYEIRKLRGRLLAGEIAKKDYAGQVLALRNRYPILSLPLQYWTISEEEEEEG